MKAAPILGSLALLIVAFMIAAAPEPVGCAKQSEAAYIKGAMIRLSAAPVRCQSWKIRANGVAVCE